MCIDYLNNTVSDSTMRCILQAISGTPADGLQDFTLYLVSIVLSFVLIYGMFSVFMVVAKRMQKL